MPLHQKNILITGGTGSFGHAFVRYALTCNPKKVTVLSRDEWKQWEMKRAFNDPRLHFVLGDVRDKDRLREAFRGMDIVIHAAALKQLPMAEEHPAEFIKTNVNGAMNVIDAAVDVPQVIALSTDKAVNPTSLYGASKMCSDRLFLAAGPQFALVRYGNVLGSRGSLIPLWRTLAENGLSIPITDERMTRFWLTLDQAVDAVITALRKMKGGEIFVPKIPSMRITDLAKAIAPGAPQTITGIRPGEKLHELLISPHETVCEYQTHYVIRQDGKPGFTYASDTNPDWFTIEQLQAVI